MTFVFPFVLGGLALIGVPVLIHLIMRQKPRTLPFPAFRFLLQRHRTNLRKLRLRHILLLTMRILLIALICLALARPKLFYSSLNLSSESPVAAVFLFDTSLSMDYKTSDGQTRFEEARKRGLELLDNLPEGSKVAILETGEPLLSARGIWMESRNQARDRIQALKLRPANAPLTQGLENAYRLFSNLGDPVQTQDHEPGQNLPRILCVFSDRTRGSWKTGRLPNLFEAADQVPPYLEGLQQARSDIPPLIDLLKELRTKIPRPPDQDYPEQTLLEYLDRLREHIPGLTPADLPPDQNLVRAINGVRREARGLLAVLHKQEKNTPGEAREYRAKLISALHQNLRDLRGVHGLFIDVGVDQPVDLALLDAALPRHDNGLPRQVFRDDETIDLQVVVGATGKDFRPTLDFRLGKVNYQKEVEVKAGQRETIPFKIDAPALKLGPGIYQVEINLKPSDQLPFNNSRFLTFAVRQPKRILVLTEETDKAVDFARALQANGYVPEVKAVSDFPQLNFLSYPAIYLFCLQAPTQALWDRLDEYVLKGGSLGIIPGGREIQTDSYNQGSALKLMPGLLRSVVDFDHKDKKVKESGGPWDLDRNGIFTHPILRPFQDWKDKNIDIMVYVYSRSALTYWETEPLKKDARVLVSYADPKDRPALLERIFSPKTGNPGKVLLFTTPLDDRDPPWNHYKKQSFYVILTGLTASYLAGESERVNLNFISGEGDPLVALPLGTSYPGFHVYGPDLSEQVQAPEGRNNLVLKKAAAPGNYSVVDIRGEESEPVTRFSVNMPPEESDLTPVQSSEIETLLGQGALVQVDHKVDLREAMRGHWSQPIDLLPILLLALLFILAFENLLANKFYRQENRERAEEK